MNKHGGYKGNGKVIDYSVNINPLGIPQSVKEVLVSAIDGMIDYPDIAGESAREVLAKVLGISHKDIIMGNGACELIYLFARAIKPKRVLLIQPTFNEYERSFTLIGSEIHHFCLSPEEAFHLRLGALEEQLDHLKPQVVVLCNPCNPTGQLIPLTQMERIVRCISQMGSYLFVDESFIDFTGEDSIVQHLDYTKVFSLRSMTKYYAIPGLRIGYGVAHETVIQKMEAYKEPWTMNGLALAALPRMMKDYAYHEQVSRWIGSEHHIMYDALGTLRNLQVFPSATNFFLCKLTGMTGYELNESLEVLGAHIRVCDDFRGLTDQYIRIALRGSEDNRFLIESLKGIL